MRSTLVTISILPVLALSQTILQFGSGALPDCAKNCQTLTTAQYLCIPPVAPATSNYDACFCNSNYFADNLASGSSSSPSNVCNSVCTSTSDQAAIQNWYDSLCKSGSSTSGSGGAATTSGAPAASSTGATTSGTDNGSAQPLTSGQKWWNAHAKWIAMAIVLICAFLIILVVGILIKRYRAKKHAREAAMAPPVVWGPHQNQHYTGGITYGTPNMREKGKGNANAASILPTANSGPVDYSQPNGQAAGGKKKLRKFFGGS